MRNLYKLTMMGRSEEEVRRIIKEAYPDAEILLTTIQTAQKLKELNIGDKFVHANAKEKIVFEVVGNPEFNRGHGSATRVCNNGGNLYNKSCRLEVIKVE